MPVAALEYLFLGLIAMTIVISLQSVGIILVVAMLVTPAATAQLLTNRFSRLSGRGRHRVVAPLVGLYVSYWTNTASAALIVLVETAMFSWSCWWPAPDRAASPPPDRRLIGRAPGPRPARG